MATLYYNGRVLTGENNGEPIWASAFSVVDGKFGEILHSTTAEENTNHSEKVDLEDRLVLASFIDGHTHIGQLGAALTKVDLRTASSLEEIQQRLVAARRQDPAAPRLLGRSWLYQAIPADFPTRQMIDQVLPDVPVYLDSNDYHCCWLNSAALKELGIDENTECPPGGSIHKDSNGHPTGVIDEAAMQILVWGKLESFKDDAERDAEIKNAMDEYLKVGVCGAIDMAMDESYLAALSRSMEKNNGRLPMRVSAHWLIASVGDIDERKKAVDRAYELSKQYSSEWLRIVGIKILSDGTIDGCTAAVKEPYKNGLIPEPIWSRDELMQIIQYADSLELQVAVHAIGDLASHNALDAIEHAAKVNGEQKTRRHRIEHLEYCDKNNIKRLAEMGVIASMQPVHHDSLLLVNWKEQLGDFRQNQGFQTKEFLKAGAHLALGTDAPTAPHHPLPSMFNSTTRKSVFDESMEAYLPEQALEPAVALSKASAGSAYSCHMEHRTGSIKEGLSADFVVLDKDPFRQGLASFLVANAAQVYLEGRQVYSA